MSLKNKKVRTGILVFVLVFPVFFVSLFYLRGRRNLGFDQKINSVAEVSTSKTDTIFNSIVNHSYKLCDNNEYNLSKTGSVRIIGYYPSNRKTYRNQLIRIAEAYKSYDNVQIVLFDSTEFSLNDYPNVECICVASDISEITIQNFNYPEEINVQETFSSFILLDQLGYIKGVYNGFEKSPIDDLLLETKVLLKKIEDEKR